MPAPLNSPLLDVRHLTKRFPGVVALDRVDLTLHRGEVLAVVGENGAGKSTLMNILAGVQQPDSGQIRLEGRPAVIRSVPVALRLGIALIHQELNLCDNLDVGANIFLGREPHRLTFIKRRSIDRAARRLLESIGLDVSPRAIVGTLPIGRQQMVEIAKALSVDARILIMDEPTSSLSGQETEALFRVVRNLRRRGVSVVYISHRLGEVERLADRVVVLRDGRNAGQLSRDQVDHRRMVQLMVGRDVAQFYSRQPRAVGTPLLEVENLIVPAHPTAALSFQVRCGEIVGIAGLVGAGRTELLRTLFGVDQPLGGTIKIGGRRRPLRSPVDAIRAGVALVPEDRKQQGLILEMTVRENISLAGLRRHRRRLGFLNVARERSDAAEMIAALNVKTPGDRQVVRFLSGGNQQKVVLAKWLALKPRLLLLDEPTRGIDVGAKQEIYHLMERLAASGIAILFASSEMEEILGMSDRALVMHQGRIAGALGRAELSEEAVMHFGNRRARRPHGEIVRTMNKVLGILVLLVAICVVTAAINPVFLTPYNLENIINWTSLFSIISIGVALVIITGGIDLSIGSVVGLTGCLLPYLLVEWHFAVPLALAAVMLVALAIGLFHGLLVTRLRLQPFIVTLCGLLLYRGITRWFTADRTQGFGGQHDALRQLATGKIGVPLSADFQLPVPFLIMLVLALAVGVFLNKTIYGRYLLALGRNSEAARYSGVPVDRMVVLAYVTSAMTAGLGGILFALDLNSVQPAGHGEFYELYAIAAAVLGGCSLRGGEGSILGVVIGAAVMRVLYNSINLLGIPTQLEFAIIGLVILGGVVADELLKRFTARRRERERSGP